MSFSWTMIAMINWFEFFLKHHSFNNLNHDSLCDNKSLISSDKQWTDPSAMALIQELHLWQSWRPFFACMPLYMATSAFMKQHMPSIKATCAIIKHYICNAYGSKKTWQCGQRSPPLGKSSQHEDSDTRLVGTCARINATWKSHWKNKQCHRSAWQASSALTENPLRFAWPCECL